MEIQFFMSVIKTIGVMTGNSLDAVDVVLTAFDGVNICDLALILWLIRQNCLTGFAACADS